MVLMIDERCCPDKELDTVRLKKGAATQLDSRTVAPNLQAWYR